MKNNQILAKSKIKAAMNEALEILSRNMIKFIDDMPEQTTDKNGIYGYEKKIGYGWHYGFWTGLYWLAYEITGKEHYRCYAQYNTEIIIEEFRGKIIGHTDIGFMCFPSCVASYKLTKSKLAKEGVVFAADSLMSKYNKSTNVIFESPDENVHSSIKISNLINMLLLNVSYRYTSSSEYRDAGNENIKLIQKHCVLNDGSVSFRYYFDTKTKRPIYVKKTGKKSWYTDTVSRAQAWAIFGFAVNYADTKNPEMLDCYHKVTDYFIAHLPSDYICRWDLDQREEALKDTLSALIAVCGIFEMSRVSDDVYIQKHYDCACKILNSIIDNCSVSANDGGEGLIKCGSVIVDAPFSNHENHVALWYNVSSVQADYFYLEALTRILCDWNSYWL